MTPAEVQAYINTRTGSLARIIETVAARSQSSDLGDNYYEEDYGGGNRAPLFADVEENAWRAANDNIGTQSGTHNGTGAATRAGTRTNTRTSTALFDAGFSDAFAGASPATFQLNQVGQSYGHVPPPKAEKASGGKVGGKVGGKTGGSSGTQSIADQIAELRADVGHILDLVGRIAATLGVSTQIPAAIPTSAPTNIPFTAPAIDKENTTAPAPEDWTLRSLTNEELMDRLFDRPGPIPCISVAGCVPDGNIRVDPGEVPANVTAAAFAPAPEPEPACANVVDTKQEDEAPVYGAAL